MLVRKGDQEAESISIIGDSVWTGVALTHQPLCEIGLNQLGERGLRFHRTTSLGSNRKVASISNSGTAEMYQYVPLTWP